eukprot:gene8082-13997_t
MFVGVFLKVKVEVKRPPFAECTFLYKFYQGPYNTSGKAFDEVSKLGKKFCCAGIYFDDPEVVASNETCFAVGVLIEKEKATQADTLEVTQTMKGVGYHSINFPVIEKAMCSTFPFKANFLCILVAVSKVYPALRDYIKEHGISPHPYIEYYKGDKIFFVAPLEKHMEFYVPEYEETKNDRDGQSEKSE